MRNSLFVHWQKVCGPIGSELRSKLLFPANEVGTKACDLLSNSCYINTQLKPTSHNPAVKIGLYDSITAFKEWTWNHVLYILLFLHLICLPMAVIAAVVVGLYGIAIVDGVAFLILLGVWAALWKK